MTIDAKPRVRTAVDMVTRRGTRIANTAYPSAPTRPPPAIAINAQPSCTGCWWSVKYFGNSTLSIGRYSAVTVRSIIPRVRNTRRFQTKRSPSAIPDTNPWGREVWCGLPAPSSCRAAIARMDNPNAVAVIHIVVMPPTVAIIKPPMAGPTIKARLRIAS
ncbi:Uncharacterised protein [Mycobacterium tuberculosis]|uniref:Uncharacterized protein n=2 Tax=Mycobacterium tuberculosis TaxID=1773 RepID=A0A655AXJ8_MYCTX|nr:Uncharacterised protein [Mycobacterium tuberculosis]CKX15853.1 Uncharacterised protein [Mycobacterium tuberculosis]